MFRSLALLLFAASALFADAPPNIVLIVGDDLGCFELGCYGQKKIKTPHIDALAASGMKFNRFYSGNAVCAPSRCCLMTGMHPGHATIRNNGEVKPEGQRPIRAEDVTVAELLKSKGYTCGAIGKWGLGMFDTTGSPLKQGFDSFYGYNCQRHAHSHYPVYLYRNDKKFDLPGNNLKGGDSWSHELFEKESLAFIDANAKKPFFLFCPFTVPHAAVQAPEEAVAEYRGKLGNDPPYTGKGYQPHPTPHAGYAAMVSSLDRTVGKIVAKLKALGIEKNTLVLFSSDNGPTHNVGGTDSTFFESAGKLRGLKGSLYEGGIRVPMIAAWPGTIAPGTTSDTPFAFWDMLPTLCAATGVAPSKDIDGISFLPTLLGKPQTPHAFLYWEFPGYGGQQAVQAGKWKAVRQQLAKGIKTELYDLQADQGESTDVSAKNPDVIRELEAILKREHRPSENFPLQSIDKK